MPLLSTYAAPTGGGSNRDAEGERAFAQSALVDGAIGLVWAPRGVLSRTLQLTITDGKIARIEVIADSNAPSTLAPPNNGLHDDAPRPARA